LGSRKFGISGYPEHDDTRTSPLLGLTLPIKDMNECNAMMENNINI
jgi:hypothetical protein